jgi:tetrahydromethanopterin S-methyltransferase subunit G
MIRAEAGTAMKIFDLIDRKIEELVKELKERYGDDVGKLLRDLS